MMNYSDVRLDSPLGEQLLLGGMTGQEDLSTPFEITLQLYSKPSEIVLTNLLGLTMTVHLPLGPGKTRPFHGHVVSIAEAGSSDGYDHYTATLRPWFWLLSYNSNCRIFQGQSVLDIARTIFHERGFVDFDFALSRTNYREYEYAVQYRESDFTFLSRLFEQEGIYYFFVHDNDKHTLVLADSPQSHSDEHDAGNVEYRPWSEGHGVSTPHLTSWTAGLRVVPGAYVLDDYDFERPRASLEAKLAAPQANAHADSEVYEYPGEYKNTAEGETLAQVRLEALHAKFERMYSQGDVRTLGAGRIFTLKQHPRAVHNQKYLVVESRYELDVGERAEGSKGHSFHCGITVMSLKVPFRPAPTTPRPVIVGHQTARVVGSAGAEIFTDKYGRVKVHFPWDRTGEPNEKSSCWIRVAQAWAGSGLGSIHVPRVGQEVLVSFLEGDPDRPIITGRVYNANSMPPYELPAKAMVSGTKSQSTPGGSGYNELSMDDTAGKEKIVIHGQFDMESTIEHDQRLTVHNDRTSTIDGNDVETVGKNQTVHVVVDQLVTVDANQTLHVGANQTVTVGANQTVTVSGMAAETIALAKALSIGAGYQVSVGGVMNETVAGLKAEEVGGMKSLVVGAASTEHVKGSKSVKTDKNISEEATESISSKSGKTMTLTAGEDFAISGKKKGVIELADELTIKVGSASITLKKNGDIVLNGKKISVTGSGDVVLKGTKVTQN